MPCSTLPVIRLNEERATTLTVSKGSHFLFLLMGRFQITFWCILVSQAGQHSLLQMNIQVGRLDSVQSGGKFHFCIPLITQRWCGAHISHRLYRMSPQLVPTHNLRTLFFTSSLQTVLAVNVRSEPIVWSWRSRLGQKKLTDFFSNQTKKKIFSCQSLAPTFDFYLPFLPIHLAFIFHIAAFLSLLLLSPPSVLLVCGQAQSINSKAIS